MNNKLRVHFKEKLLFPFQIRSFTIKKVKEDGCSTFAQIYFMSLPIAQQLSKFSFKFRRYQATSLQNIDKAKHYIMLNQLNNPFLYVPMFFMQNFQTVSLTYDPQRNLELLILQSQFLKQEQNALIQQFGATNEEIQLARMENQQLKMTSLTDQTRTKRKYRKRRTWLEKKFRCNLKGCKGKYSSKIALNCHKRKKHPKQRDQ